MALSPEKQKLFNDNVLLVDGHARSICNACILNGIEVDVEDVQQAAKETLFILVSAYHGLPDHFGKHVDRLIPKMLRKHVIKYYSAKPTMKDCGDNCIQRFEEKLALSTALSKLPVREQMYIRMFYYENKNYDEIAAITTEEANVVRICIENSLKQLKIALM